MHCGEVQCSSVQCIELQCCAVQFSTFQLNGVLCSLVKCSIECSILMYSAFQCHLGKCILLHYNVVYFRKERKSSGMQITVHNNSCAPQVKKHPHVLTICSSKVLHRKKKLFWVLCFTRSLRILGWGKIPFPCLGISRILLTHNTERNICQNHQQFLQHR